MRDKKPFALFQEAIFRFDMAYASKFDDDEQGREILWRAFFGGAMAYRLALHSALVNKDLPKDERQREMQKVDVMLDEQLERTLNKLQSELKGKRADADRAKNRKH